MSINTKIKKVKNFKQYFKIQKDNNQTKNN